jgi:hypothetical protein
MRVIRGVASGLTTLLLVAGLTACGSSSDGTATGDKTGSPSGTSTSTPSTSSSAAASGQVGQALLASMTAAMTRARTVSVGFTTVTASQQTTGRGMLRFGKTDYAAAMNMTLPSLGRVRVVVQPKALYMRLPAAAGLPAGKPWIKIQAGSNDPLSKALGPVMDTLQQSFDPDRNLRALTVIPKMTAEGTETLDGVQTKKYTGTVDLSEASAKATGTLAEQFRALVAAGTTTIDYTIWVDGKSLPRKFQTVTATEHGRVTSTATYHDWGKPVTIKVPPPRQITTGAMLGGS